MIDVRSHGVVLRLGLGPDAWRLASSPGLSLQKTSYPSGLLWASLHQGSLVFFFIFFFFGCASQLAEVLVPRPGNETRPLAVKAQRLLDNQGIPQHGFL